MDEFPSGQRGQTVNLLRKLRWSESILVHQIGSERKLRLDPFRLPGNNGKNVKKLNT